MQSLSHPASRSWAPAIDLPCQSLQPGFAADSGARLLASPLALAAAGYYPAAGVGNQQVGNQQTAQHVRGTIAGTPGCSHQVENHYGSLERTIVANRASMSQDRAAGILTLPPPALPPRPPPRDTVGRMLAQPSLTSARMRPLLAPRFSVPVASQVPQADTPNTVSQTDSQPTKPSLAGHVTVAAPECVSAVPAVTAVAVEVVTDHCPSASPAYVANSAGAAGATSGSDSEDGSEADLHPTTLGASGAAVQRVGSSWHHLYSRHHDFRALPSSTTNEQLHRQVDEQDQVSSRFAMGFESLVAADESPPAVQPQPTPQVIRVSLRRLRSSGSSTSGDSEGSQDSAAANISNACGLMQHHDYVAVIRATSPSVTALQDHVSSQRVYTPDCYGNASSVEDRLDSQQSALSSQGAQSDQDRVGEQDVDVEADDEDEHEHHALPRARNAHWRQIYLGGLSPPGVHSGIWSSLRPGDATEALPRLLSSPGACSQASSSTDRSSRRSSHSEDWATALQAPVGYEQGMKLSSSLTNRVVTFPASAAIKVEERGGSGLQYPRLARPHMQAVQRQGMTARQAMDLVSVSCWID